MNAADLAKQLGDLHTELNIVWTLLTGFLVMFMQAGFALVETGLTRAKNVAHTMAMNLLVYAIAILGFWSMGFALQMGGVGPLGTFGQDPTLSHELAIDLGGRSFGLMGLRGFFLSPDVVTPGVATLFLFQLVFMDTAATIPTGAGAERWKFTSFVLFSFVSSSIIYPIFANWTWGGGWLSTLGSNLGLGHGHVDFAGSSVVHMSGGVMAFVVAQQLGPRLGKYAPDGSVKAVPGHSIPLVVLGTCILAFGWFGFNPGSTLSGSDTRIAVIAVNTMLASSGGAIAAFAYTKLRFGAPDVSMMCNGMLSGLVAITAPCAFVTAPSAVLIGLVAGVLVIRASLFIEQTLRVDDPVGAVAVHGVCGAWGILALGLLADGRYGEGFNGVPGPVRGLLYGDVGQFLASCIGIVTNLVWVGTVTFLAMKVVGALVGNRSAPQHEVDGLDVSELGGPGYAPDALGRRRPSAAVEAVDPTSRILLKHP
ncbi:MAG TPA: ammonium transporter [Polyangiaceae bacterium]|jgi:Amt family ammonium transporter|nr:ammonium transporter [Polyangiaceae bacterium]